MMMIQWYYAAVLMQVLLWIGGRGQQQVSGVLVGDKESTIGREGADIASQQSPVESPHTCKGSSQ